MDGKLGVQMLAQFGQFLFMLLPQFFRLQAQHDAVFPGECCRNQTDQQANAPGLGNDFFKKFHKRRISARNHYEAFEAALSSADAQQEIAYGEDKKFAQWAEL
jgi:hypothetical protein